MSTENPPATGRPSWPKLISYGQLMSANAGTAIAPPGSVALSAWLRSVIVLAAASATRIRIDSIAVSAAVATSELAALADATTAPYPVEGQRVFVLLPTASALFTDM